MKRLLLVAALALGAGCGEVTVTPTAAPVDVSGTLTKAGKPFGNVRLTGTARKKGGPMGFQVAADGKFSGKVIPGTYTWYVEPLTGAGVDKGKADAAYKAVPEAYRDTVVLREIEVQGGESLALAIE